MQKMGLNQLSRVSVHMTQGLWELMKVKKVTGRVSVTGILLIVMNLPNTTLRTTSKYCCNKGQNVS